MPSGPRPASRRPGIPSHRSAPPRRRSPRPGSPPAPEPALVRGEVPLAAAASRRFHLQVTAAPSPTADTEANLFTAIPDLDHLDQIRASQSPDWVVFVFRALGEMAPDRRFTDPFASKDL